MNYIQADWPAPANIKAFTTTRMGCPLSYPYDANQLKGSEESSRLRALLNAPTEPVWLKQTHTNLVVEACESNIGTIADASFSHHPKQICTVFTADCLPLLICNKSGTHVAAIHAGWRGLANGIIENTIQALHQPGDSLLVWLGPAIGPAKFEVGRDVYDAFVDQQAEARTAFLPQKNDKWMANLYTLASMRLAKLGITSIYGGNYCTFTQDDLFYSYRRDKGQTGRMASLIWIE